MGAHLPSGIVTFVLTDVVGSTRAWDAAPEQMDRAIARHAAIIEDAVVRNGGTVLKARGEGDSTFSVFARPTAAVAAAREAQLALLQESWPEPVHPLVRIGVHTGEAVERDGDYFGPVVNRAARLRSIATGGQVLLSAATAALVDDALPQGVELVEAGEVHLRDLDRAERVFVVTFEGFESGHPTDQAVPPPPQVEVQLLGPVEVLVDGDPVNLGGPKERTLLATLALSEGAVTVERLVAELWEEDPPPTARKTLQTYAWRLRRVLTAEVLRSIANGYELHTATDVRHFEGAVSAADADLRSGDPAGAVARLDAALATWRGAPLGGCHETAGIEARRRELEELRALAVEHRAAASLDLGMADTAIVELERLVSEHPYRERRWQLLALALYRCGRQGDALATFQRARSALVEGLGVGPGPELLELEQAILEQRPELARAPAAASRGLMHATATVAPRRRPPAPATPLVGRSTELAAVLALLADHRLVTITGAGGVGKTRLAIDVTASVVVDVAFCDLSPLSRAGGIDQALAQAVGVDPHEPRPADADLVDAVTDAVGDQELLIVVDNCEHVIDEAATALGRVLAACPASRILSTSRQPLGLPGEQVAPLAPLRLPVDETDTDAPAVELLTRRAREANPSFGLDDGNRAAIIEICRRVEGVPLALELAAARLSHLTAQEVASKLEEPLRLLTAVRAGANRHRGLEATIAWSHELLEPDEAALFRRLAVFAGRFDLADVEACCIAGLASTEAIDLVGALVDRSLVVAEHGDRTTRYRLLHMIRQFAAQQLAESEDEEDVREAHCRWFLARLEAIPLDRRLLDTRRRAVLVDLREDVRSAIEWAESHGRLDVVARLTASMFAEWQATGAEEIDRWLPVAVDHERSRPPSERIATAVSHLLYLFRWDGDRDALQRHRLRLAALAETIHDDALSALAYATLASFSSRMPGEADVWERYAALATELAPPEASTLRAMAWCQTARSLMFRGRHREAVGVLEEAVTTLGPDATRYTFSPQVDLALANHLRGRHDLTLTDSESLMSSVSVEARWDVSVYVALSTAALGDIQLARHRLASAVASERTAALPRALNDCRVAVGALLCHEQRWTEAAAFLGPLGVGSTSYNHIGVLLEHYRAAAMGSIAEADATLEIDDQSTDWWSAIRDALDLDRPVSGGRTARPPLRATAN